MTPEIQKSLDEVRALLDKIPALVAVRNELITYREKVATLLGEMDKAIAALGGVAQPTPNPYSTTGVSSSTVIVDAVQYKQANPLPQLIPIDAEPEPEKKSKWAKVGGFFKKVWPVASIALVTAVPGGAAIAAGVNAVAGAGTADPVTAGAAGLLVPIGAAIVKGMEKPKE